MWITGLESDASRKIILNALFSVATYPQVPDREPRSSRDEEDLDGGHHVSIASVRMVSSGDSGGAPQRGRQ
jgi:hypothetical protein